MERHWSFSLTQVLYGITYNRTFPCMEAKYPYAIKNQPGSLDAQAGSLHVIREVPYQHYEDCKGWILIY